MYCHSSDWIPRAGLRSSRLLGPSQRTTPHPAEPSTRAIRDEATRLMVRPASLAGPSRDPRALFPPILWPTVQKDRPQETDVPTGRGRGPEKGQATRNHAAGRTRQRVDRHRLMQIGRQRQAQPRAQPNQGRNPAGVLGPPGILWRTLFKRVQFLAKVGREPVARSLPPISKNPEISPTVAPKVDSQPREDTQVHRFATR